MNVNGMAAADLVNSCRVCQTGNQDGDFVSLYDLRQNDSEQQSTWQLTEAGELYEDMLGTQIEEATVASYPRYLCNSCDLQMRLFKKLKVRAFRTLELLDLRCAAALTCEEMSMKNAGPEQRQRVKNNQLEIGEETVGGEAEEEEMFEAEEETDEEKLVESFEECEEDVYENRMMEAFEECEEEEEEDGTPIIKSEQVGVISFTGDTEAYYITETKLLSQLIENGQNYETASGPDNGGQLVNRKELKMLTLFEDNLHCASRANADGRSEQEEQEGEEEMEEEMQLVEGGRERSEGERVEQITIVYTDNGNKQNYRDVQDVDVGNEAVSSAKMQEVVQKRQTMHIAKRTYQCNVCDADFLRRADFLQHRKSVHGNKYPCPECPKLLRTSDALRVHLQLHKGLPPYSCSLCLKTFNQKVHYKYHMDKHNNVRNFECQQCHKAFLSKTDLAMHTRTHTGERPYACEICGKDFLLLQHLKMHRYSHFGKSFECGECKQKFISPSTLRTHVQTIHSGEPQFHCEFCVKRFRRKHHLMAHYKVHQKVKASSSADELTQDGYQLDHNQRTEQGEEEEQEENEEQEQEVELEQEQEEEEDVMQSVDGFMEITSAGHLGGILVIDDDERVIYGDENVIAVECDADGGGSLLL